MLFFTALPVGFVGDDSRDEGVIGNGTANGFAGVARF